MSNFRTVRTDDEVLTSPSSDEKMDTGSMSILSSESFKSQDTPNSLSSDFEDGQEQHVLRLQNPSETENNDNLRTAVTKLKSELNDSLISKMSNLNIESPKGVRPKNLGISPPKFSSTLTLTTNHPLMGLGSPDENFPDLIPKKLHKIEDDKDLSLSSIEDERPNDTNGFYSPQRNTSKNNLYFTENFVTADSQMLNESMNGLTPDVARVDKNKRKIVPRFSEVKRDVTPQRVVRDGPVIKYVEKRQKELHSTPKALPLDIPEPEEFHSGVAEWCESPSHLRTMPNFELPIEMSTNISTNNDLESPDVVSSSTQEDRSAYQALLDPYTGSVALRPTAPKSQNSAQRRKIQLPPEEDRCSLDSISGCSMESEEEPPAPEPSDEPPPQLQLTYSDDEDTRRMERFDLEMTKKADIEVNTNQEHRPINIKDTVIVSHRKHSPTDLELAKEARFVDNRCKDFIILYTEPRRKRRRDLKCTKEFAIVQSCKGSKNSVDSNKRSHHPESEPLKVQKLADHELARKVAMVKSCSKTPKDKEIRTKRRHKTVPYNVQADLEFVKEVAIIKSEDSNNVKRKSNIHPDSYEVQKLANPELAEETAKCQEPMISKDKEITTKRRFHLDYYKVKKQLELEFAEEVAIVKSWFKCKVTFSNFRDRYFRSQP